MEQIINSAGTEVKRAGPRDVLFHVFGIILLYLSTFSFGALIFQIINILLPDQLNNYSVSAAREILRMPVAILTVAFPAYLGIMSWLQRDLERNPEKRGLRTRKWLIYITLFVASLVILVDLITLIYHFLSGDLPLPFVLKVLTVMALAAVVFAYHLWILRNERPALKDPRMRWFVYAVGVVCFGMIVWGYYLAGTPQAERARKIDAQRINDLQSIQYQIQYYWQAKQALPAKLADLRNEMSGFVLPTDPETKDAYEYQGTGEKSFELCATFKTSNSGEVAMDERGYYSEPAQSSLWEHGAERTCFSRTIDPDLYPPLEKAVPTIVR
ncbi:MAG: DUF5671 domain-containing protein [Candidatus Liptonbacteria bacterium]